MSSVSNGREATLQSRHISVTPVALEQRRKTVCHAGSGQEASRYRQSFAINADSAKKITASLAASGLLIDSLHPQSIDPTLHYLNPMRKGKLQWAIHTLASLNYTI